MQYLRKEVPCSKTTRKGVLDLKPQDNFLKFFPQIHGGNAIKLLLLTYCSFHTENIRTLDFHTDLILSGLYIKTVDGIFCRIDLAMMLHDAIFFAICVSRELPHRSQVGCIV